MKKGNVHYFEKIFVSKEIEAVFREYENFSEGAVIDYQKYMELRNELNSNRSKFYNCSWKVFFFESMDKAINLCKRDGTKSLNKRIALSTGIQELLWNTLEEFKGYVDNQKYFVEEKIRFWILALILDIICAFSDKLCKIQHLAMVYDIVNRLNDKNNEFRNFYGNNAGQYILKYSIKILSVTGRAEGWELEQWMDEAQSTINVEFLHRYCRDLWEELRQGYGSKESLHRKKVYDNQKKSSLKKDFSDKKVSDLRKNYEMPVGNGIKPKKAEHKACLVMVIVLAFLGCIMMLFVLMLKNRSLVDEIRDLQANYAELNERNRELASENIDLQKQVVQLKFPSINTADKEKKEKENQDSEAITSEGQGETENKDLAEIKQSLKNPEINTYRIEAIIMKVNRNVRSEQSKNSAQIGAVKEGDIVHMHSDEIKNGWAEIQYEDKTGYVFLFEE